jgi:uncharacterized membrane protein HdeD (DUF308 family)
MTIGVLFMVPGLIALVSYYSSVSDAKKHQDTKVSTEGEIPVIVRRRFPIEAIGSILLGLWFLVDPAFFANLLMIVLSVILIIGGLQQIIMLSKANKWKKVSFGFYVVPLLILISGVYSLLNPNAARNTILIVIGVACLVYASYELFNWFMFMRHKPRVQITDTTDTIDTPPASGEQ